jgi:hypothetical protein
MLRSESSLDRASSSNELLPTSPLHPGGCHSVDVPPPPPVPDGRARVRTGRNGSESIRRGSLANFPADTAVLHQTGGKRPTEIVFSLLIV